MKRPVFLLWGLFVLLALLSACHFPGGDDPVENQQPENDEELVEPLISESQEAEAAPFTSLDIGGEPIVGDLIRPEDLIYLGAFRLPDDSGGMGWDYSGHGLTYYAAGDPMGEDDGFAGSLFMVGHDQQLYVGEISIPAPIISENLDDLNTASTLQPLTDISGGLDFEAMAIPRMGIEVLPPMGDQVGDKLHFAIGQHIQDFEPSHGWTSVDLAASQLAGLWVFDGYSNYTTNDYLFEIPQSWVDIYLPGYRLATGRFREGVWGGLGPALFAYAPWLDGNPPAPGAELTHIKPLLLYGIQQEGNPELQVDQSMMMNGYAESDHWWGGAWLTAGDRSAVIFTGTKALGKNWYGFANGVEWDYACMDDPNQTCPEVPDFPYDDRGFWAEDYQASIIFFDPATLGQVALDQMAPYEPQPYAIMTLDPYFFDPEIDVYNYKRDLVGAAAFNRDAGLLFVIERLADEAKSVIHVFQISP